MRIKVKDQVTAVAGKDKGRAGEVEKIYPNSGKVLVKGLNIYKKHVKKSEAFPKGGLVEVNRPLLASKVMLVCPNCKEKTRIGISFDAKNHKQRVCKKCQKIIK